MKIKRLLIPGLALSAMLAIAAFGSNGVKNLFTTQINPAEAAGSSPSRPGLGMAASGPAVPISSTVSVFEFVPAPELPARPPDAAGVFSGRDGNTLTLQSFFQVTNAAQSSAVSGGTLMELPPSGSAQAGVVIVSGATTIINAPEGQGQPVQLPAGAGAGEIQGATVIGQSELATVPAGALRVAPGGTGATLVVGSALPAQATPQSVVVTDATKIYHDVTPLGQLAAGGHQTLQQTLEAGSLDGLTEQMMVTVWGHIDAGQLTADVIVYQNQFPN